MSKKNRAALRRTLLTLSLVLVVAFAAVGGTIAWLTSTSQTVTNTFSVGDVKITLDETDVDVYGVKDGDTRVTTNDYKLLPGHTYIKDPTVHVAADSEESYVRMIVTINELTKLKAALGVEGDFLPEKYVEDWDATKWLSNSIKYEGDICTVEFRYYQPVSTVGTAAKDLEPLFTKIVVPDGVKNDAIKTLENLEITVVAHAIQTDGFNGDVDAAWAAFN